MIRIIRVTGSSLSPEVEDGDFVVIAAFAQRGLRKHLSWGQLKPGDVLVFRHQTYGIMIKKFDHCEGDGFFVTGSHPDSVDSAHFGPIERDALVGKVIWHIPRPRA